MDTIIIFTNWQRIYDLQNRYKLSWIPENIPIQKITVSNDKSFIIALDQMTDFTNLVNLIDTSTNIYILHHNSPDNAHLNSLINLLSAKGCEIKMVPKQHDNAEYKMIQDIDACVKGDYNFTDPNINDIIKAFDTLKGMLSGNPKLEVALDFLHECLVEIPNDREKLTIAFSSDEKDIEKLITKMKDSKTKMKDFKSESKEYFESFISLRDELLRLAGV